MPKEAWQERSVRIVQNIKALEKFQTATVIHAFLSDENRQEANLIPLLELIIASSKNLLVPIIEGKELISVELTSFNHLTRHAFGVLEPTERTPSPLEEAIDFVLVPLLAVDKSGNRLGYGKGYYDRFLKRLRSNPFKLGVAFEFQVLDEVPAAERSSSMSHIDSKKGKTSINRLLFTLRRV